MTPTYRRIGFLVSALLHLAAIIVFLSHADNSSGKNDVDTTVPLSLAMFQETVLPEPAPEAAPVTPPETPPEAMPEKTAPEVKTKVHPPEQKPTPKPVTPVEPVIKPAVHREPDIKNNTETVARPEPIIEPAIEPVAKQETAQAPRLSLRQESLKQRYIKMLLKRIHRKKHYPRRARRNREEGEVLVSFVIGQSGDISDIRVSRSSGYVDLDKAAVKTLARVSPLQPLPGELGMTSWELAVPIAFDLRK